MKSALRSATLSRRTAQIYQLNLLPAGSVLVQSFPKSGSTWFRNLILTSLTGSAPDVDDVRDLIPPLPGGYRFRARLRSETGMFCTHERRLIAPVRRVRVLQIVRDPVTTLSSYWDHLRAARLFSGSREDFVNDAVAGRLRDGYGTWAENVTSWAGWPDNLVVHYEELVAATAEQLGLVFDWMGVPVDSLDLARAVQLNSRENLIERSAGSKELKGYDGEFFGRGSRASDGGFTEDERSRIESGFGHARRALGYGG